MKLKNVPFLATSPRFECPFCKGEFQTISIKGQAAITHSEPACPKFLALDPAEFVEAARHMGVN